MRTRALRAAGFLLAAMWLHQVTGIHWAVAPRSAPPQPAGEGVERLLWGDRLDPNRAPREALLALPGVGPARADAIMAARPFCRIEDLMRVRGIGTVRLSRMADSLEIRDRPKECGSLEDGRSAASRGDG